MAKSTLTDKGVGEMIAGSFISDLAQLWMRRIDNPLGSSLIESTEKCDGDRDFEQLINALIEMNIPDIKKIALRLDEAKNGITGNVSMISYRNGFQDGVRMIIQSIMG